MSRHWPAISWALVVLEFALAAVFLFAAFGDVAAMWAIIAVQLVLAVLAIGGRRHRAQWAARA